MTNWKRTVAAMIIAAPLASGSTAQAQSAPAANTPWSAEVGIGFDNSISGNINSGAIGTLNGQTTVITKNSYEGVYGTGLALRFGGGYMLNDTTELRGVFTFQSLDADLTPMGDIGASQLYAQYSHYQTFGLDVGLRRYADLWKKVRGYGEGEIGLGFIDKTNVELVAPALNLVVKSTDFYDRSAAFTFGANMGVVMQTGSRVGIFVQGGFRKVSGLAQVDQLFGTGLETINDNSGRWTFPFITGVRLGF